MRIYAVSFSLVLFHILVVFVGFQYLYIGSQVFKRTNIKQSQYRRKFHHYITESLNKSRHCEYNCNHNNSNANSRNHTSKELKSNFGHDSKDEHDTKAETTSDNSRSGHDGFSSNQTVDDSLPKNNTSSDNNSNKEIKSKTIKDFKPAHVLPHCMVIGEKKCGTTALVEMLMGLYPNVHAVPGKENHYFTWRFNRIGLEQYKKELPQMKHPNDIIMERSPDYFRDPDAPFRIHKYSPKSKFLLIVCDPVRRVFSDFLHEKFHKFLKKKTKLIPFLTYSTGKIRASNYLLEPSLYAKHIETWLKLFPREQLHIINEQQFIANPYEEFQQIEKFLGLENKVNESTFYTDERTGFKCWRGFKGNRCVKKNYQSGVKGQIHPVTEGEIKTLVGKLREFFIPYNDKFFKLIGKTFKWDMNKA